MSDEQSQFVDRIFERVDLYRHRPKPLPQDPDAAPQSHEPSEPKPPRREDYDDS